MIDPADGELRIRSDDGVGELRVSFERTHDAEWDDCHVRLTVEHLTAAVACSDMDGPSRLVEFFRDLGRNWEGWTGEKEWGTTEEQFGITATADKLGHVRLLIMLRSGHMDCDWRVECPIFVTAGQLEQIARDAEAAFGR